MQQDNVLVEYHKKNKITIPFKSTNERYECALLQNRQKGTIVAPIFVAEATHDAAGNVSFSAFDFKELLPSKYPQVSHARSRDVQHIINDLR
jgi:hypothetical protein